MITSPKANSCIFGLVSQVLVLYCSYSFASDPPALLEHFENWALQCPISDSKSDCFLFQRRVIKDSQESLFRAEILQTDESNNAQATFYLPLGVDLIHGINIIISDEESINIRFNRCSELGCQANFIFKDDTLQLLKLHEVATVMIKNGADELVPLELSLLGFNKAWEALSKKNKFRQTKESDRKESKPAITVLRDSVWLNRQQKSHFVIHLLTAIEESEVHRFLAKLGSDRVTTYYKTQWESGVRYNLLLGNFVLKKQATKTLAGLPIEIRNRHPWIRTFGDLQRKFIKPE